MPTPPLIDMSTRKQLRSIGHKLKPVVMIAAKGLSPQILDDIDTRLDKNELIKIKIATASRDIKKAIIDEICRTLGAQLVQQIGNTALLLRRADKPHPRLSNLLRIL